MDDTHQRAAGTVLAAFLCVLHSRRKARAQAARKLLGNERKWCKDLMDAGWTAFPSVIIERQGVLGLDALDVNILLHLASYWWTKDNSGVSTSFR